SSALTPGKLMLMSRISTTGAGGAVVEVGAMGWSAFRWCLAPPRGLGGRGRSGAAPRVLDGRCQYLRSVSAATACCWSTVLYATTTRGGTESPATTFLARSINCG